MTQSFPDPGGGYLITIQTPGGPAHFRLPQGNLPDDIARYYFRSDTPSGISTEPIPPEIIDRFRQFVRSGNIVPLDQAAQTWVLSQGGLRAGDVPGVPGLAPLIGGLPGGLGIEWWQVAITKANQEAQNTLAQAVAAGYFGAAPPRIDPTTGQYDLNDSNLTLQARNTIAQIVNQAAQTSIARQLAENTIAQTQAQLSGTYGGAPTEEARRFNEQLAAEMRRFTESLSEQQRQFNEQLGFSRERFGFEQQQATAAAMADPRRIVEAAQLARLYGGARGGAPGFPLAYLAQGTTAPGGATTGGVAGLPAGYQELPITLSPENVSYLTGQTLPQFGQPQQAGRQTTLGAIGGPGYDFRQTPAAYRALSPTGRAELGGLNLALRGQTPQDWEDMIRRQLPAGPSALPAAYAV